MKYPNNPYIRPRITAFDYLGLTGGRLLFAEILSTHFVAKQTLRILDVGCGSAPWKALWTPYAKEYVGVDLKSAPTVDIVAPAENIPVPDATFDAVFSVSVLEHVRGLNQAVAEIFRILKPGGTAIIGVPFIWPIHGSPHDYWRWTPHGLAQLFSEFSSCEVRQMGGWLTNYLLVQNVFWRDLQERCLPLRALWTPFILINNIVGRLIGLRSRSFTGMSTFYVAIVKK